MEAARRLASWRPLRRIRLADWPAQERDALVGSALALLGAFLFTSTWTNVVLPMQQGFGVGVSGEVLLRQLPDIAALLFVPAIGAFSGLVGAARLARLAAISMLVGSLCMMLSPSFVWLVAGMCVTSIGRTLVGVLAYSVVGVAVTEPGRRATAFSLLGAMISAGFIVGPVLTGGLLGLGGWRAVGAVWIMSSLLIGAAARLLRAQQPAVAAPGRKEPWTPICAGVTLVGVVQWLGSVTLQGALSTTSLAWAGVTIVAAAIWFALAKSLSNPSLDGRTLSAPGLRLILLVAIVAQCGELWFYVSTYIQVVHRYTPLETALALLPPQVAGFAGAFAAAWLVRRVGLAHAGTLLLAVFALSMFVTCLQTMQLPVWVTVAMLTLSALAEMGSSVCVAQAVMNRAPAGSDRQVSSYRSAATAVGNALALLLVASTVSSVLGASMREQAKKRGVSPEKTEQLVAAVRANMPSAVIGREMGLSPERVEQLREVRRGVLVDGFRAHGAVSGAVLTLAAIGFWFVHRRDDLATPAAAHR